MYELKATKKDYLSFRAVAKHQYYALTAASSGVAHYKIPDEGVSQKPFDGFQLIGVDAYIGIMFNTNKQKKDFYLIDIETFKDTRQSADRKSLTEEKAAEIGEKHTLH